MEARTPSFAETSFGIYIHWPFCAAKCPYCDFNSYARQTVSEERYLSASLAELDFYAALTPGRTVTSIFFGGGTPSLMSAAAAGSMLDRIGRLWPVARGAEVTLEANPSSVEAARFQGYRAAGVNRISIGVQSLDDAALRFLGRLHNRAQALEALAIAKRHFERVSFDMIYARPQQSAAAWRAELSEALSHAQEHVSLYQLTIEPGTAFFDLERAGKLHIPESDEAAALYEITQELCDAAGLSAYEISNHARPGAESRHNLTYWRYGDYAGIGPGAHGRLSVRGEKWAFTALRDPAQWAEAVESRGNGIEETQILTAHDQAVERLLMGFRLSEGLDLFRLKSETGYSLDDKTLISLIGDGLVELSLDHRILRVAKPARLLLNTIIKTLNCGLCLQTELQTEEIRVA